MTRTILALIALVAIQISGFAARAESKAEYENRIRLMLDFAVHTNDYVRQHLTDRGLSAYAHAMAEQNASEAERMTPPASYNPLHPHFLLVLENIERSFYYAKSGDFAHYRQYQNVVRKELQLLEVLAEQQQLELYLHVP